jgi:regulator of replication initiation timing
MTPPPDLPILLSSEKSTQIGALLARIEALTAHIERLARRIAALEAENAILKAENVALREKLILPPKTPDNSSTPPSQRHKANGETKAQPKDWTCPLNVEEWDQNVMQL